MEKDFEVDNTYEKLVYDTLNDVYNTLKERGYNPTNQIVGYILSGDLGYISNYKDSREKIMDFDRSEVVAVILEEYLNKK